MAADRVKQILEKLIKQLSQWLSLMGVFRNRQIQSVENDNKETSDGHKAPVLMVPNHEKTSSNDDSWIVYEIVDDKLSHSNLSPPPCDSVFLGSSEGWLEALTKTFEIILYKPFVEKQTVLRLPQVPLSEKWSLDKVRKWWVMKFITFTPDPIMNPKDLTCVVVFGKKGQLAYIIPTRDNKWSIVKAFTQSVGTVKEVLCYNSRFYCISFTGSLLSFNLMGTSKLRAEKVLSAPCLDKTNHEQYKDYLVESPKGGLLYVTRYIDRKRAEKHKYLTTKFIVWKLSYEGEMPTWKQLKSLGQCALFIGENASISVFAPSNNHGCTKNHIYFTDDKYTFCAGNYKPSVIGVYNMKTRVVTHGFGIDEATFANMEKGRFPIL